MSHKRHPLPLETTISLCEVCRAYRRNISLPKNVFFKCWNEFKRSVNEISMQAERPEGRDGAKHASQFKNTCFRPNKADYYFGLRCGIYERMEQAEKDTLSGEGEESRQNYELALSNNEHEFISKTLSES